MFYSFIKKCLFALDPETSHEFALKSMRMAEKYKLLKIFPSVVASPRQLMGLSFPNPIGLAAGLDKNGDYIDALAALGFGFIEVGTVTKKPQTGNPKPRLFRLEAEEALINRMGFNNKGVDYLIERLKHIKYKGILGINIGKNRDTPIEAAADDYLELFEKVAPFASYVTINISSPNTENLRDLQQHGLLKNLLQSLKKLQSLQSSYVPLVVKIAPDLTITELQQMVAVFLEEKIDGIIATNTTVHREGVGPSTFASEPGGLSGRPLASRSTELIKQLKKLVDDHIPIIGCGGIDDVASAQEKMAAGASLLQVYTGLIYQGPGLVRTLVKATS